MNSHLRLSLVLPLMWSLLGVHARSQEPVLIAHWPLKLDSQGAAASTPPAVNYGVRFEAGGPAGSRDWSAVFDGKSSYLEVPNFTTATQLAVEGLSIAVWVNSPSKSSDLPGEVISQYDPNTRHGFRLAIDSRPGVTSSQANWRNLHFGIDQGTLPSQWTNHGRLGQAVLVFSMAVHEGQLFAGTCEAGSEQAGRVFRYDGSQWTDCGAPDRCNAITSMAVYKGGLYVASGKYRLGGSALEESENPNLGGRVFRYAGDHQWIACGQLPAVEAVSGMVVFGGKLYASSMYAPAGFYRYEGEQEWTSCGTPDGKRVESLTVFDGHVYATGYDEGAVYRYDGVSWEHLGKLPDASQTYGFATYQGQLYVSEWPNAKVFQFGGSPGQWIDVGRLGDQLETMPLVVYNGKMYGGTLPSAEVYRFDDHHQWVKVGRLDVTPDVKYRRVWSMAVFQGRLFAGTLPSGSVHSMEAGWNVTYDRALADGWNHLAAVAEAGKMSLYVNGQLAAQSAVQLPTPVHFPTERPLQIGMGSTESFNGRMSDLRIFNGVLTASQIQQIMLEGLMLSE